MSVTKYDVDIDLGHEGTSHRYMIELVGSNKSVLDVGCSSGYLAKVLNAFGNTVTGVEYDPAAAEAARAVMDRVEVADLDHADLTEIFGDTRFEVIVFGDVLEHLRDPLPVLRQARALLAPGGYIVISIPNISHGDVRMSLLLGRFRYVNLGLLDVTHLRFFTRASLQELLADAGFTAAEVRTTKAPLFGTELGVRPDEVDPAVVERLQQDPDATTYQFVLTAVPDDATQLARDTAWRLDETQTALKAEQETTGALRELLAAQRGEHEAQLAAARAETAAAVREREEFRARVSEVGDAGAVLRADGDELRRDGEKLRREAEELRAELDRERAARAAAEATVGRLSPEVERLHALEATRSMRARRKVISLLGR